MRTPTMTLPTRPSASPALLGYAREEIIGRRAVDLGISADPAQRGQLVADLATQGEARDAELVMRTTSGAERTAHVSKESVELASEACILPMTLDMTECERLLAEVRRLAADDPTLPTAVFGDALARMPGRLALLADAAGREMLAPSSRPRTRWSASVAC